MRSFILFVAGISLGIAVIVTLQKTAPSDAIIDQSLAAALTETRTSPRVQYSPGSYPQLSLPNGQRATIKSVLNVPAPMRFGAYVWDDRGVARGPIFVRIDLGRQLLSVFRDGHEIGSTVILYGTDGKPTPTGAFSVQAMDADYHSHTYDAPMPYMLRLTDDGVAIHASAVRSGSATHGCIGVPRKFAELLFAQAKLGDRVFIMPAQRSS